MRPWRIRLTVRRSRVQWALLSIVLLVSILSATMLASLFLLNSATERFSAREELTQGPEADLRVTHSIVPNGDPEAIIEASIEAAGEFFGDVPFESEVHLQGGILAIPRDDRPLALGYLAFQDGIEDNTVLGEGRWPEEVPGATIEVALPAALLDDLDQEVGDTLEVYPYGKYREALSLDIVGIYQTREPETDYWRFDPYDGLGYRPDAPVPFSGGRLTADGFGPLIVARDELVDLDVITLSVTHLPDYSEASLKDIADIIEREEGADQALSIALGAKADTAEVFTRSGTTLGKVVGSLAVTRSNVLVTGLLLLVLSIAALGQTSRLMAERRHAEQHLMTARGASSHQLLYLGMFEAIVLAAIVTAVSPFLARLAYRVLARLDLMKDAGMDRDPGLPPLIWIVTGVVGLVLIVILIAPLLRRDVTFVEGEQARSRQNRATTLQRSGLDIALLILAILAYLQLRGYGSLVMTTGGVAGVDPLLASGPALALLAGALVCVRLIPAASRFLEGVASRGRRAVTPLAAWEVGRRSTRAVSAILLLTLAVSVGSFSLSFLSTWRASQVDQAGFIHPADVEIGGLEANALNQYDIVNDATLAAVAAPVFEQDGEISASLREGNQDRGFSGRPVHLIAMTNTSLASFTEGRVGTVGGTVIAESLALPEDPELRGILLPGSLGGLEFSLTLSSSETAVQGLSVSLRVLIQDDNGLLTDLDAGTFPIDGEERTVRVFLGEGVSLSSPSSIVGLQTLWFTTPGADNSSREVTAGTPVDLELSIDELVALVAEPPVPVVGLPPQYGLEAIEVQEDINWYGMSVGVAGPSLDPEDDQVHIEMEVPVLTLLNRTISVSQMAFRITPELPVVANEAVLSQLGLDVGDRASVEFNDVVFKVHVVGAIPNMPGGAPTTPSMVAHSDQFQIMLVQAGAPAPGVTSWWTEVPDANTDRYLSTLPSEALATTRIDTVHDLQDDPLRVGIQAALWLVIAAAVTLAALGFGVHAVVTVRARELEFAQLRAVGLSRGALTRLISAESALLAILGTMFGLGLGIALGYLVAPLISVGPDGRPPIPPVVVDVPWGTVGLLAAEVGAVLALVVFLVSLLVRRIDPAALLRVEG